MLPEVLSILHEEQLLEHGGGRGVRDAGMLESALARPRNSFAYGETDPFALSASYAFGIAKNHPFVDGNKRTAFIASVVFLELNGFVFEGSQLDVVETVLKLAAGELSQDQYAEWLRHNSVPVASDD
nr:type II toxin-antitoxin system death-on-curing family toxin [Parvularcula mediterranea]